MSPFLPSPHPSLPLCGLILLLTLPAMADTDDLDVDTLPRLSFAELGRLEVVSSTKQREERDAAPSIMHVVTCQEIKEKGYQTLFDILSHAPGWDFATPHGGWVGQYGYLRGTRTLRQILVLVDGVVQNNINDHEMGRYHSFPLASVAQVEIISGPAAALYGANALLGVINIISKEPGSLDGGKISLAATSSTEQSSSPQRYNLDMQYGKVLDNDIGLYAAMSYIHSNDEGEDYYDPDNLYSQGTVIAQAGTSNIYTVSDQGFDNHQQDIHLKLRLDKGDFFAIGLDYADMNEGLASFLMPSTYYANHDGLDYQWHTSRLSTFMTANFQPQEELLIRPRLYYRQDQIKDDSGFAYTSTHSGYPPGTMRTFSQDCQRLGLDINALYTPQQELSLLLGLNGEYDETENEQSSFSNAHNPTYYRHLLAAYGQAAYQLNKQFKGLLGGRYDKETDSSGQFSPRLSLVYTKEGVGTSQGRLISKLLYGRSFRALANYEKYDIYNVNLVGINEEPEIAESFEMQTIYQPQQNTKVSLSLWHTTIDKLKASGTEGYTMKNNEQHEYRDQVTYGLTATLALQPLTDLNWSLDYTHTRGKNKGMLYQNSNFGVPNEVLFEDLIHVARHKINSSLAYQLSIAWRLNLDIKYVGKRQASPIDAKYGANDGYDLNGDGSLDYHGDGTIPGYTLTDLHLSYGASPKKGWIGSLKIHNLFDTDYIEPTRNDGTWWVPFYHPQPGRTITLSLGYLF